MTNRTPLIVAGAMLAAVGLALAACSATTTAETDHSTMPSMAAVDDTAAETTTASTADGLLLASWGDNVSITFENGTLRFVSDGLPNHERQAEYAVPAGNGANAVVPDASTAVAAPDPTKAQNYDFTITTNPELADEPTPASQGTIGVMISGAALFNPYEGDGSTVATANNFTVLNSSGQEVAFLDSCNGHPNPTGAYHYHALPTCITAVVDEEGGPSHLIGVAFDGFPIYGDRALDGSQLTADDLDECSGIFSATPEYPDGIYHYVLLDTADSTSSIRCFSGTVDASLVSSQGGMGGMHP